MQVSEFCTGLLLTDLEDTFNDSVSSVPDISEMSDLPLLISTPLPHSPDATDDLSAPSFSPMVSGDLSIEPPIEKATGRYCQLCHQSRRLTDTQM